jgi:hypothetical protein
MDASCEDEGTSPNEYGVTRRESIGTNLIAIEWSNFHGKQSNNVTFAQNSCLTTLFYANELARTWGGHHIYLQCGLGCCRFLCLLPGCMRRFTEGGRETSGRPGSGQKDRGV